MSQSQHDDAIARGTWESVRWQKSGLFTDTILADLIYVLSSVVSFFFPERKRETEEVNSSEHSRERQDISPPPFPLTQARSDSVRNVIERLLLSERAIKLRLLLESELLVASIPKGIPWTLVYTTEHFLHTRTHRLMSDCMWVTIDTERPFPY